MGSDTIVVDIVTNILLILFSLLDNKQTMYRGIVRSSSGSSEGEESTDSIRNATSVRDEHAPGDEHYTSPVWHGDLNDEFFTFDQYSSTKDTINDGDLGLGDSESSDEASSREDTTEVIDLVSPIKDGRSGKQSRRATCNDSHGMYFIVSFASMSLDTLRFVLMRVSCILNTPNKHPRNIEEKEEAKSSVCRPQAVCNAQCS